jgi:hypothetical protein
MRRAGDGIFAIVWVALFVVGAAIWIGACVDCDKRGGVLIKNAWGWPACVEGAR